MDVFTIKDLENLTGIKAHTIRMWEQRYSFLKPIRSNSNIRCYNSNELRTILNISLLNRYGYKISHISRMPEGEINEKILLLPQVEALHERLINELMQCMLELDMEVFEFKLDKFIRINGIEKCIVRIIFPFLERIGILWLTNHINPAQEHLVSNIIRSKIIAGTEGIKNKNRPDKHFRKILLFLPEGEYHELGLLFIYYLLKKEGFTVLYVGANIPVKYMARIAKRKEPVILYTHLTSVVQNFNTENFLLNIQEELNDCQFVISGKSIQSYKKKLPPNIHFRNSIADVVECIVSLDKLS
jgi:DNA-binding transcriptional MerR regulator